MTQTRTHAPIEGLIAGRGLGWRLATVLAGSWMIAATAWAEVPMFPVPVSLQTFGVLAVAALSGRRLTAEIIGAYLFQAAIGLPVLAGGNAGIHHFAGPTGGYLIGFLVAGVVAAAMAERWRGTIGLVAAFLIGHVLILAAGWAWLSVLMGPAAAWTGGVAPFLVGSLVKSAMALAVVKLSDPLLRKA
jgi:biotin transport system substrate-specific component